MRSWERGRGWQSHSPSPHGSPIVWLGSQVHGALGGQIWQSGWGKSNIRTACDLVQKHKGARNSESVRVSVPHGSQSSLPVRGGIFKEVEEDWLGSRGA